MIPAASPPSVQLHRKQIENGFTPEILSYFKASEYARRFIRRKSATSKNTASTAKSDVLHLAAFVYKKYEGHRDSFDRFIDEMVEAQFSTSPGSKRGIANRYDPYELLAEFLIYLQEEQSKINKLGTNRVRHIVSVAKKFLRMCGLKIYNEDFHELVYLPRLVKTDKAPVSKTDVTTTLNACEDIRLKTAVLTLAGGSGPRPIEACALRNMDCNFLEVDDALFESPSFFPMVTFRAEYTKMRIERVRRITKECARQMRAWYKRKYRKHKTSFVNKQTAEVVWVNVQPKPKPEDLFLAYWHYDDHRKISPRWLYGTISKEFADLMDKMGIGFEKDNDRHKITLHSFRRFVKTTISDQGLGDYSEWYIGHDTSTYYRPPESEQLLNFVKMEPYLTFLDVAKLEATSKDLQSRLDMTQEELIKTKQENKQTKDRLDEVYGWMEEERKRKANRRPA